jgi:hypothetical protein
MHMLLVILAPCLLERENAVDADVIPKRARVVSPNPMRKLVLNLVSGMTSKSQKVRWHNSRSRIFKKASWMRDRNFVLSLAAKHQKIIRRRDAASRTIIHNGFVREVLRHRPVAHGERLFPNRISRDELEP